MIPKKKAAKAQPAALASDKPRLILISHAEEIPNPNIRPEVHAMLSNQGLYIGGDSKWPNTMIPFWVQDGKVWSMKLDSEMNPERFLDSATFRGPFTPDAKDDPKSKVMADALKTAMVDLIFWQEHNRESQTPMIGPGQNIVKTLAVIRSALGLAQKDL